jgi:hypothetical protein
VLDVSYGVQKGLRCSSFPISASGTLPLPSVESSSRPRLFRPPDRPHVRCWPRRIGPPQKGGGDFAASRRFARVPPRSCLAAAAAIGWAFGSARTKDSLSILSCRDRQSISGRGMRGTAGRDMGGTAGGGQGDWSLRRRELQGKNAPFFAARLRGEIRCPALFSPSLLSLSSAPSCGSNKSPVQHARPCASLDPSRPSLEGEAVRAEARPCGKKSGRSGTDLGDRGGCGLG